jgi:hypothetical protein
MRKQWFGDSRDYVKWNYTFTESLPSQTVVYLAMARPDELGKSLHPEVRKFFDQYKDLGLVEKLFDGRFFSLLSEYQKAKRILYFDGAESLIKQGQEQGHVVVFVDPDTGIEPRSGGDNKHLSIADLERLAKLMRNGDKVIVYQHAPIMRSKTWINDVIDRLGEYAWTKDFALDSHYDETCASDVCFIKVERSSIRK